eukprot:8855635-Pyramimonas_sp.AAC.1
MFPILASIYTPGPDIKVYDDRQFPPARRPAAVSRRRRSFGRDLHVHGVTQHAFQTKTKNTDGTECWRSVFRSPGISPTGFEIFANEKCDCGVCYRTVSEIGDHDVNALAFATSL